MYIIINDFRILCGVQSFIILNFIVNSSRLFYYYSVFSFAFIRGYQHQLLLNQSEHIKLNKVMFI